MKPHDFIEQCTVRSDGLCKVPEGSQKGTHSGEGWLATGRVAWTRKPPGECSSDKSIDAYVEGIGVNFIDPRQLQGN